MPGVIFSGGPSHGSVYEVQRLGDDIHTVVPEPVDIYRLESFDPERIMAPTFRRGVYRPRGRYYCGNWARDAQGRVIYDYAGVIG